MQIEKKKIGGRKVVSISWEANVLYSTGWRKEVSSLVLRSTGAVSTVIDEMMASPKHFGFKNFEEAEPYIEVLMEELPDKWWQEL